MQTWKPVIGADGARQRVSPGMQLRRPKRPMRVGEMRGMAGAGIILVAWEFGGEAEEIACPRCSAPVGEQCDLRVAVPHHERIVEARNSTIAVREADLEVLVDEPGVYVAMDRAELEAAIRMAQAHIAGGASQPLLRADATTFARALLTMDEYKAELRRSITRLADDCDIQGGIQIADIRRRLRQLVER